MAAYDFEGHITDIPDYPEKGVVFKDITTLLKEPEGFHAAIDAIADHFKGAGITKVVGAEARGFLIGAPVAFNLEPRIRACASRASCLVRCERKAMSWSTAPMSFKCTWMLSTGTTWC